MTRLKTKSFFSYIFKADILIPALICSIVFAWADKNRWAMIWLNRQLFDDQLLTTKLWLWASLFLATLPFFILFVALIKKIYFFLFAEYPNPDFIQPEKELRSSPQKPYTLLILLAIGIGAIFYFNNLLTQIDTVHWIYQPFQVIQSRIQPVGLDFRMGLYRPAQSLFSNFDLYSNPPAGFSNNYPPAVYLFSLPFLIINENDAYLLQTILLYTTTLAAIALAVAIGKKAFFQVKKPESEIENVIAAAVFFLISFYAVNSYPFLFAVERGNYDIFAIFFVLLFLWCVITRPKAVWLQVFILSVAFHLKIYPGILFLIPLIKHGKKSLLPIGAINAALFLVLGPVNAWGFFKTLLQSAVAGDVWIGNHSAVSFSSGLVSAYPLLAPSQSILQLVFTLLPVLLWLVAVVVLTRRGKSDKTFVLYTMISIPVMNLIPSLSHDYQLVILFPAVVFLFLWMSSQYTEVNKKKYILQVGILSLLLLFIARPYGAENAERYLINNKYLFVLALQGLMLWNILAHPEPSAKAEISQAGQRMENIRQ